MSLSEYTIDQLLTELGRRYEPAKASEQRPAYDIALRPFWPDDPEEQPPDPMDGHTPIDDIVVNDVEMFRAEQMDNDHYWVCCYLRNGDRITWSVYAGCRPKRITWTTTEYPQGVTYEHDLEPYLPWGPRLERIKQHVEENRKRRAEQGDADG